MFYTGSFNRFTIPCVHLLQKIFLKFVSELRTLSNQFRSNHMERWFSLFFDLETTSIDLILPAYHHTFYKAKRLTMLFSWKSNIRWNKSFRSCSEESNFVNENSLHKAKVRLAGIPFDTDAGAEMLPSLFVIKNRVWSKFSSADNRFAVEDVGEERSVLWNGRSQPFESSIHLQMKILKYCIGFPQTEPYGFITTNYVLFLLYQWFRIRLIFLTKRCTQTAVWPWRYCSKTLWHSYITSPI